MKTILRLAAALLCTAAASSASAQAFPSKPVTIIVPFTAGGPTDTVARSLAQGMSKSLGQPVVVENTAGAGGTIASTRLKNAAPDGYTLLLHHIGMSTAPALYRKLAFNPQTDFEMVGMVVDTPMTLIARSDFPAKGPQRVRRLREGEQGQAEPRERRHRLGVAPVRLAAAERDAGRGHDRSLQGHGRCPQCGPRQAGRLPRDQTTNTTQHINAVLGEGVRRHEQGQGAYAAEPAHARRERAQGIPGGRVARRLCAQGHAQGGDRQLAGALQQALTEPDFRKRMTELGATVYTAGAGHARRARGAPEGRDRTLGPGHQGRRRLRRLTVRPGGPGPRPQNAALRFLSVRPAR